MVNYEISVSVPDDTYLRALLVALRDDATLREVVISALNICLDRHWNGVPSNTIPEDCMDLLIEQLEETVDLYD